MSMTRHHLVARLVLAMAVFSWGVVLGSGVPCYAADANLADLPSNATITGSVSQAGGVLSVAADGKTAAIEGTISPQAPVLMIKAKSNVSLSLKDAKGKTFALTVQMQDYRKEVYPDSHIALSWPGGWGRFYVRPNPARYKAEELEKIKADWLKRPGASELFYTLEIRPAGDGQTQLWLNSQLINILATPEPMASYKLSLTADAKVESIRLESSLPSSALVTLPLSANPRVDGMPNARVVLDNNPRLPASFPKVEGDVQGIAVDGLGTIAGLGSGELQSLFWYRHATDNLPEQRMFTVPADVYSHAYILCAVDDSPEKVDSFTLRVTRYGTSRGNAMADTMVRVPDKNAQNTDIATRVGRVVYGQDNARQSAVLWLIKVPVKSGLIQDIIYDDQRKNQNVGTHEYLDVELLDPLRHVELDDAFPPSMTPTNRTYSPKNHVSVHVFDPANSRNEIFGDSPHSRAHVFAIALEKSPATMQVRANLDYLVFYKSDQPQWRINVKAREAGQYSVQWDFADVDGKIVTTGKQSVNLAANQDTTISVPINTGNGWYAARFKLLDAKGSELVDHRSSFVMLPPDTRQAGFESPFGTWLFWGWHGGDYVIERQGPLLQRAGLRHAKVPDEWPESLTSQYGFTTWNVPWSRSKKETLEAKIADHVALIEKYKKLWPSVNKMLIWHESGSGGAAFPSEMWGEAPPAPDAKTEATWKERMEYVNALGAVVREKFPDMKMQYGNDGSSVGIIAELLRRKFPREYIDTIASENVGQTIIPEKPTTEGLQATWYVKETAKALGYGDVPIDAAHEWMNHRDKSVGLHGQAEWYVRDALHGLAYGFDTIALGTLYDAGNGYFYSIWGDGGLTERYPYMQPKPTYAAIATLTSVLDSTNYKRTVPTGSTAVYALEFERKVNEKGSAQKWVYALWALRGNREATLVFPDAGTRTVTDIYGRETKQQGKSVSLKISTAATYVTSSVPIESIALGESSFPGDEPPASVKLVDAMDSTSNWSIDADPDSRLERVAGSRQIKVMPHRTKGNFVLREVMDDQKGKCLELELVPQGEIWKGVHEYAMLKLKNPVGVAGPYKFAGVWIKGNGSWGEIMWELESSKGKKYFSATTYQDWPANNAMIFDGWRFVRLSLPQGEEWTDNIKITGLAVTIPRQTLYLTDMVPVINKTLRFKGLGLYKD